VSEQAFEVPNYDKAAKVRYINAEWRDKADSPRIGSRETRRANTAFQDVTVLDARARLAAGDIDLDTTGFTLTGSKSKVTDFRDEDEVAKLYYPEMQDLICRVSGANRAFVRGHLIRTEKPIDFNDGYSRFVHCDYNIRRREEMSLELLERDGVSPQDNWEYVWYNTWQPFDHQVQNNPLAVIDWDSLPMKDVIDYYYTGRGLDSLVAAPVYSPDHQFWYFSKMETDEVLVITQMDGRPGNAVYCPHTAFDVLDAIDPLPRRSIETRLMAVFEKE
jgi:hypothetical protein